jgi:hypothetical protein
LETNIGSNARIGQIPSLATRFADPTANWNFTNIPSLEAVLIHRTTPASRVVLALRSKHRFDYAWIEPSLLAGHCGRASAEGRSRFVCFIERVGEQPNESVRFA